MNPMECMQVKLNWPVKTALNSHAFSNDNYNGIWVMIQSSHYNSINWCKEMDRVIIAFHMACVWNAGGESFFICFDDCRNVAVAAVNERVQIESKYTCICRFGLGNSEEKKIASQPNECCTKPRAWMKMVDAQIVCAFHSHASTCTCGYKAESAHTHIHNVCFAVPEPNCFNTFVLSAFNEPFDG